MNARRSRFSGFGSSRRRGKAAGAVMACAVMLLAGCGGSSGSAADASAGAATPIVRGDVLGVGAVTGVEARLDPFNKLTVTAFWDNAKVPLTQKLIGYHVQVASGSDGPWADAGWDCKYDSTGSSQTNSCRMNNQTVGGTYSFRVAAITKLVGNSAVKSEGAWSAGSVAVTVLGFPAGTPATPTVVAGDSKVTVTVAAGTATDGTLGGAPTSYTVTALPAVSGGTCTVTGASGSCPVTGLTNGTAYTFTATATNTAPGTSAASVASASVTPLGVPSAPVIGTATATGPTTATVAFTVVASIGSSAPATSYTATSYPAGGTGTLTQAGSGTINVTGLTAGVTYEYFTVTATSIAGPSLASARSRSPYQLGGFGPGGGVVFVASTLGFKMVDSPCGQACHYLEAQREAVPRKWCNITTHLEGTREDFGYGYRNTAVMATNCNTGAGESAWNSESGGVQDWFLPSERELFQLVYWNNDRKSMRGSTWSSSQGYPSRSNDSEALYHTLGDRDVNAGLYAKSISLDLRAIRAF